MDRFKLKVPDDSKAGRPRQSSRIGWLSFFGGLTVMVGAVLIGFLIEEKLQTTG